MALKSWSISQFAVPGEAITLLDSGIGTILLLCLMVSNNSAQSAHITVARVGSDGAIRFQWAIDMAPGESPLVLDTKMVFTGGDRLMITSDQTDVAVDGNGDMA